MILVTNRKMRPMPYLPKTFYITKFQGIMLINNLFFYDIQNIELVIFWNFFQGLIFITWLTMVICQLSAQLHFIIALTWHKCLFESIYINIFWAVILLVKLDEPFLNEKIVLSAVIRIFNM